MTCAVYIMANTNRTVLYTGVTSELANRVAQHKSGVDRSSFTSRYNAHSLVYYELTNDITTAIRREKQIKGWTRKKKIGLIETLNPDWRDLAEDWDGSVSL